MKNVKTFKRALFMASFVLVLAAFAFVLTIAESDADGDLESKEVGDVMKFAAGSGKITHNPGQDVCVYNEGSKVTIDLTVLTTPTEYNKGWDDVGTLAVTAIEFSENSDVIYIPSYIIDKVGSDIGLYKVVSMDDSVIDAINAKVIGIVLPQALRDIPFVKTVAVINETSYTDTKGNVVHYSIDETGTAYMNGYGGYSMYANNTTAPDIRYCEQGTVTKVDYAAGQTTYDTKMSQWSKNDMTSSDYWVCGLSWGDMIGAVLTYEVKFGGDTAVYSEDSFRCGSGSIISVNGNTVTIRGNTVTATCVVEEATFLGWNVNDGDIVTSDMELIATYDIPEPPRYESNYVYDVIIVILIILGIAGALHVKYRML